MQRTGTEVHIGQPLQADLPAKKIVGKQRFSPFRQRRLYLMAANELTMIKSRAIIQEQLNAPHKQPMAESINAPTQFLPNVIQTSLNNRLFTR